MCSVMVKDFIDRVFLEYVKTKSKYYEGVLEGAIAIGMMYDIITTDEYRFICVAIKSVYGTH